MDIGEDVKYALRPFSVSSSLSDSNPNANDSASATPENLKALAAAAISVIVQRQSEESALSGAPIDGIEDINLIKRTYSALVCIYLEAACKDLSSQQFFSYLTAHCGLSDSASNPLCDLLAESKHELRKALSRTADHSYLRRLTGVEWKLDYCVSASDDKDFKELI
uniref:TSA: Wollemia nobilis Ref_Wollemi_Transcript_22791_665 transcribed RNA sequence n=1 Tax=Wollemia nobilis TaxID=56998 RepID=A0A0C9QMA9_9CONI